MIEDISDWNDNILFQNEEVLMIKDGNSSNKAKVSYFGIVSDTPISAIINIISSAIGGGCFLFPSILGHLGLPLTSIIFLFVLFNIYYTIDLLRMFVVDTKFFYFALMTSQILGDNWLKVYTISSLLFYLSTEINYLSEIYSLISNLIDFSNNRIIINIVYFIITISTEIAICSYISNIQKVHLLSLISILLFIIILIYIIIQGISSAIVESNDKFNYDKLIKPNINNYTQYFFEIMSYIIEYVYGFSYHSSYPTLLSNLRNIDDSTTKKTHIISFIFISFSYLLITFFGFLLKTPMSEILSIKDVSSQQSFNIIIFKIIICLFLFTVVPLRFIVIRDNYSSLLYRGQKLSFKTDLIIVCVCIIICNLIVCFTNESQINFNIVSNFMQLFAGIFGVIISFILPVINYIGANGMGKVKSIIGLIILGIFCTIGALSVGYSIYGFAIQNEFDNK